MDQTIISLGNVQRALPLTENDVGKLCAQPVLAHPFLDAEAVRTAWAAVPREIRNGQEINLCAIEEFQHSPWQLVVGIDCAGLQRKGNIITIEYGTDILVLDRRAYGDFFAGDLDLSECEGTVFHSVPLVDILEAWHVCKTEEITDRLVQPCHLVKMHEASELAADKLMDPVGHGFKITERGDVPAIITGVSIDAVFQETEGEPTWKMEHVVHYLQPGVDARFYTRLTELIPNAPGCDLSGAAFRGAGLS